MPLPKSPMKYLMFGDGHGRNMDGIEVAIRDHAPDVLICTGDLDDVSVAIDFMRIQIQGRNTGLRTIIVPSNHDAAIGLNWQGIYERLLESYGHDLEELRRMLGEHPAVKQFFQDLARSRTRNEFLLDSERFGDLYPTVVVHGAFVGTSSFPNSPPEHADAWNYLLDEPDYLANFLAMEQQGIRLMIRGNDHDPTLAWRNSEQFEVFTPTLSAPYFLDASVFFTITPGSYKNGHFATIDTAIAAKPLLQYHKID